MIDLPDELYTDRLVLIALVDDDLPDLAAMNSEPNVLRFINGSKPLSVLESANWLDTNRPWSWVGRTSDSEFVGFFALRPTGLSDREAGYRLPESRWGSGYAAEATTALIDVAFAESVIERVWAQTMTVNSGSRRVMEKCGMSFVGMLDLEFDEPIPGSEHGDVEYELTRSSWERGSRQRNVGEHPS
jgi:RimJ/RimL family protein N-acetyltransferase